MFDVTIVGDSRTLSASHGTKHVRLRHELHMRVGASVVLPGDCTRMTTPDASSLGTVADRQSMDRDLFGDGQACVHAKTLWNSSIVIMAVVLYDNAIFIFLKMS